MNVIVLSVPPLRERGNDILLLANFFANKFSAEIGKEPPVFTDKALRILKNYIWPGNVRELENMILSLTVMKGDEVIDVPDLPKYMRYSANTEADVQRPLADVETDYIKRVLDSVNGNKSQAAKILGISRKTLHEKIKKFNPTS